MKTANGQHLDEDQLTRAMVDETELPLSLQEHLSTCAVCRSKKEDTAERLGRLGQMAARFAPLPTRPLRLPASEPRTTSRWSWGWQAYAGAAVAAALVIAVLWHVPALRSPSVEDGNTIAMEMEEAEALMTEIAVLVDNPLPAVYLDISAESSTGPDEEFIEFVVPSVENESITYDSRKRGVSLC